MTLLLRTPRHRQTARTLACLSLLAAGPVWATTPNADGTWGTGPTADATVGAAVEKAPPAASVPTTPKTAPGSEVSTTSRSLVVEGVPPPTTLPSTPPAVYRGSSISYRNVVSAIGLHRGAEPTHNPYYGMQLAIAPRYWFSEKLYARGSFDVSTELTRADWTTDRFFIGDLGLGFGVDGAYTVPVLDVSVSGEVSTSLPTSKGSRATSRLFSNALSVSLSRKLGKFSLSYSGNVEKYWNRYTTAAPSAYLTGTCTLASTAGCVDMIVQNGRRNPNWAATNGVSLSYKPNPWLGLSLGTGVSTAFLYHLKESPEISLRPRDLSNTRYFMFTSASASMKASDLLNLGFGARAFYAQLEPDGSYRTPFINRFTQLYLEAGMSIEALISRMQSKPAR